MPTLRQPSLHKVCPALSVLPLRAPSTVVFSCGIEKNFPTSSTVASGAGLILLPTTNSSLPPTASTLSRPSRQTSVSIHSTTNASRERVGGKRLDQLHPYRTLSPFLTGVPVVVVPELDATEPAAILTSSHSPLTSPFFAVSQAVDFPFLSHSLIYHLLPFP